MKTTKDITREELENVRESIIEYVNECEKNPWRDFDSARYVKDIERISAMLESDTFDAHVTCISLADVHQAFDRMQAAKKAFEAVHDPLTNLRFSSISARERFVRIAKKEGFESENALQARKDWEDISAKYEAMNATVSDDEYARLSKEADVTAMAFRNIRRMHVIQCAQVARIALLEDTSWTKQPTRYKRMRERVEAITDSALCGTGCRVSVGETTGRITINHDWAGFFTHVEHSESVEIRTFKSADERPNLEEMRNDRNKCAISNDNNATAREIVSACNEWDNVRARLRSMCEEYRASVKKITNAYKMLGFNTEDLKREYQVTYC